MNKPTKHRIEDFLAYMKLNDYEKKQYKAGFLDVYGNLTEEGVTTMLRLLSDKFAEEMADIADKKVSAEQS